MLKHFGVTPYLVFDGDYLPSKAVTEIGRENKRAASKRLGLELYRMNKVSQAHSELQKAVDVTPEMARQFIEELKTNNIQYVVAPYEADAQLVFLEKGNVIQGILSEDSDMLVFGAQRLLTKLDQYGDCVLFRRARFTACREVNLAGWSDKEFRTMAIMSGCDYIPSIDKMGLKTAHRLVRKYKTIEKILTMLAFDGKFRVPPDYLENFKRAELTFVHQRVFCLDSNKLIMASELKSQDYEVAKHLGNLDFVGKDIDPHIALGVARGDLHPMTKKPLGFARRENFKFISESQLSNSPRTPSSSSRKHSALKNSDLKSNKSITSYLQPGRTPLAELSPNVWTPSPTVSDILRYQEEAVTEVLGSLGVPISRTHITPAQSRTSDSRFLVSSAHQQQLTLTPVSVPHSRKPLSAAQAQQTLNPLSNQAKRQRLCEEPTESEVLATASGYETLNFRSRFFPSSVPDQSPSMMPKRGRRKTEREIIVWSDKPERREGSKDSVVGELLDVKASSKNMKVDAMHATESVKTKAMHATNTAEINVRHTEKIMEGCENCSVEHTEEKSIDAAVSKFDVEKRAAVDEREVDEQVTRPREENQKSVRESEGSEIVAVLESPVAVGTVSTLCKGSEDAMIPDSEDDEEADWDTDGQPLPKLDLGKFLFTC